MTIQLPPDGFSEARVLPGRGPHSANKTQIHESNIYNGPAGASSEEFTTQVVKMVKTGNGNTQKELHIVHNFVRRGSLEQIDQHLRDLKDKAMIALERQSRGF